MEEFIRGLGEKIAEAWQSESFWWLAFGFFAQTMFFMRFLVQWIASERTGKSVMPVAFWYLSMAGGVMLFAYAVHVGNPVFIVGQGVGLTVYTRNLMLIYKERRGKAEGV